jgi:acetyltransferase
MTGNELKAMFRPKTVALMGASEIQGSVGRAILENLLLSESERIFPVNPNRKTVMGLECFARTADIAEHIDLAVIATPARVVPGLVEDCGKAGVTGIIIVSGGFREMGEEGKSLEDEIRRLRKLYGMRIIGPDSIGFIRPRITLYASFLHAKPEHGKIAFISQSGPLGSAIMDWAVSAHIGFSMFASLGMMIDVNFGDLIDFLGDDRHTRSIMVYMEHVGDARSFMSAARRFARNKPIIIVKPGRSPESAMAILSRTGTMAGDDRAYDAAFKRAGAVRVNELSGLFNCAGVLDSKYLPKGQRVAIITNASGFDVIATDLLIDRGGGLAQLSPESMAALNDLLPPFWSKGNPVNILGDAGQQRYMNTMNICLRDPQVDGLVVIFTPQAAVAADAVARAVVESARGSSKPIVAAWIGGDTVRRGREVLLHNNIPVYGTPEDAVRTYLYMYSYSRNLALLYETPAELPVDRSPPKNHLKNLIKRAVNAGRAILSEEECKEFLRIYGIPVITSHVVSSHAGLVATVGNVGYPLTLKALTDDPSRIKDRDMVAKNIRSGEQLEEEYAALLKRVGEKTAGPPISKVAVQRMIDDADYEVVVGARKDRDFGTIIRFGRGGPDGELLGDVSVGLPPLNQTLARRLIEETAAYRLLQGHAGKQPADMGQLEQILVSFSNLLVDFPEIEEIEIDPLVIVRGRACAAGAGIVLDRDYNDTGAPYSHLVITPYPTRYTTTWALSDGTEVTLRAIRPEDEPLEREMLSTLSEETMRARFFALIKDITHEMLVRFCNIDYDREMAIVAEKRGGDKREMVGIGRLIIESDYRTGEYAVLVHDRYQGKGLGYKLVDAIIGIAHDKGLEEIHGDVLSTNEKMLNVARKLGFTATPLPDKVTRVQLMLK